MAQKRNFVQLYLGIKQGGTEYKFFCSARVSDMQLYSSECLLIKALYCVFIILKV